MCYTNTPSDMDLDKQLEAMLFWRGEPMTLPELCRALKLPSADVRKGLQTFKEKLRGRGLALIQTEDEYALATAPDAHELIERLRKEELARDLGKAALETLSIVLYKEKVSRRDIEYIRGVNSTAILRNLLMRGLIERRQSEEDERVFLYRPTVDLLSLLGIASTEELPEFQNIRTELAAAKAAAAASEVLLESDGETPLPSEESEASTEHA